MRATERTLSKMQAEYKLMRVVDKNKEALKQMTKADAYSLVRQLVKDDSVTTNRIRCALGTMGISFNGTKRQGRPSKAAIEVGKIARLMSSMIHEINEVFDCQIGVDSGALESLEAMDADIASNNNGKSR